MRGRDAEVASVPDGGDGVEPVLSQLLEACLGRPLTAGEFSELNSSYREAEDAGSSERTTYGAALPTTPIGLDALVMVSQLMQSALRRSLIPEESRNRLGLSTPTRWPKKMRVAQRFKP